MQNATAKMKTATTERPVHILTTFRAETTLEVLRGWYEMFKNNEMQVSTDKALIVIDEFDETVNNVPFWIAVGRLQQIGVTVLNASATFAKSTTPETSSRRQSSRIACGHGVGLECARAEGLADREFEVDGHGAPQRKLTPDEVKALLYASAQMHAAIANAVVVTWEEGIKEGLLADELQVLWTKHDEVSTTLTPAEIARWTLRAVMEHGISTVMIAVPSERRRKGRVVKKNGKKVAKKEAKKVAKKEAKEEAKEEKKEEKKKPKKTRFTAAVQLQQALLTIGRMAGINVWAAVNTSDEGWNETEAENIKQLWLKTPVGADEDDDARVDVKILIVKQMMIRGNDTKECEMVVDASQMGAVGHKQLQGRALRKVYKSGPKRAFVLVFGKSRAELALRCGAGSDASPATKSSLGLVSVTHMKHDEPPKTKRARNAKAQADRDAGTSARRNVSKELDSLLSQFGPAPGDDNEPINALDAADAPDGDSGDEEEGEDGAEDDDDDDEIVPDEDIDFERDVKQALWEQAEWDALVTQRVRPGEGDDVVQVEEDCKARYVVDYMVKTYPTARPPMDVMRKEIEVKIDYHALPYTRKMGVTCHEFIYGVIAGRLPSVDLRLGNSENKSMRPIKLEEELFQRLYSGCGYFKKRFDGLQTPKPTRITSEEPESVQFKKLYAWFKEHGRKPRTKRGPTIPLDEQLHGRFWGYIVHPNAGAKCREKLFREFPELEEQYNSIANGMDKKQNEQIARWQKIINRYKAKERVLNGKSDFDDDSVESASLYGTFRDYKSNGISDGVRADALRRIDEAMQDATAKARDALVRLREWVETCTTTEAKNEAMIARRKANAGSSSGAKKARV